MHGANGAFHDNVGAVKHDAPDELALALKRFLEVVGCVPNLYKADVDSAFRLVPIMLEHRWASVVLP